MWYTYVLLCDDGSFYIGASSNVNQRYYDHLRGKGGRYTKLHKPIKLLYTEQHLTQSHALKRERQLKGWSHNKKVRILRLQTKLI
jgi:putative endonuclease